MKYKTCKSTKTVTGCGHSKPEIEFKPVRTDKRTGVTYRKRMCRKCENEANRVKKKMRGVKHGVITPEIFKQYDRLMRG